MRKDDKILHSESLQQHNGIVMHMYARNAYRCVGSLSLGKGQSLYVRCLRTPESVSVAALFQSHREIEKHNISFNLRHRKKMNSHTISARS